MQISLLNLILSIYLSSIHYQSILILLHFVYIYFCIHMYIEVSICLCNAGRPIQTGPAERRRSGFLQQCKKASVGSQILIQDAGGYCRISILWILFRSILLLKKKKCFQLWNNNFYTKMLVKYGHLSRVLIDFLINI